MIVLSVPRPVRRLTSFLLGVVVMMLASGCEDLLPEPYRYSTLEVTAIRRSGEPVSGVRLVLYTGDRHMAYGTTGANGRHLFHYVPFGIFGVGAVPPAGYAFQFGGRSYIDSIDLPESTTRAAGFTLLKIGNGAVVARTLEPGGMPVSGTEVVLFSPQGEVAEGKTNSAGEYTFSEVPFGQYGVRALAPQGYRFRNRLFVDGLTVDEGSRELATFVLEPCAGRIRVQVSGPEGRPLGGIGTTLYTSRGMVSTGMTRSDGSYEYSAVSCGLQYGVRLDPPPGLVIPVGERDYVDGLEIEADTLVQVAFRLQRCYGAVTARVVDQTGNPVAGARLELYTARTSVAEAVTDANGRVSFPEVPCGQYGVRVRNLPLGYAVESGYGTSYADGIDLEDGSERAVRLQVIRE